MKPRQSRLALYRHEADHSWTRSAADVRQHFDKLSARKRPVSTHVLAQHLPVGGQHAIERDLRQSNWAFPAFDTIHTLGIVLVAGTIMLVDLRLLGLGLRSVPLTQLVARIVPATLWGFGLMVTERRSAVLLGGREDVS